MYKAVGMGLLLLVGGCASVGRAGQKVALSANPPQPTAPDPVLQKIIHDEIQTYHNWLEAMGLLLRPFAGDPERWQPRELDPETLKPLPPPPMPTTEEIMKRWNELLETDPTFAPSLTAKRDPV